MAADAHTCTQNQMDIYSNTLIKREGKSFTHQLKLSEHNQPHFFISISLSMDLHLADCITCKLHIFRTSDFSRYFLASNSPQTKTPSHIQSTVWLENHLNITLREIIEELCCKCNLSPESKRDLHYTFNHFTSKIIGLLPPDHPTRDVKRLHPL